MHPSSSDPHFASAADHAACRAAIRTGSRSFFAASLVLPAHVRGPAFDLYAFCRMSDDAIDLGRDTHAGLQHLRARLAQAYAGAPYDMACDRAMADLVREHSIPRAIPEALLDGFAWDAEGRRYETLQDVHAYAARVAGTVGVMMALIMGVRSQEALARACDLGVAMQLTNIARDIGEDARAGRLYLPLSWMREEGLDPDAFLSNPVHGTALARVVARLLAEADRLYLRSRAGVAHLPPACRPAILAAGLIYGGIGGAVMRRDGDSVSARAHVGTGRKVALLARALALAPFLRRAASCEPLAAVTFLLASIPRETVATPQRRLRPQIQRVLEIFERLERAEQYGK